MTISRTKNNDALRLAPIEPEEYDALADLFLGDSVLAPEGASTRDGSSIPDERVHDIAIVVEDELFEDAEDVSLLELPDPPARAIEIKPMPTVERASAESTDSAEAHESESIVGLDAIPAPVQVIGRIMPEDLVREIEGRSESEDTAARPMIEAVLLGHLPVRATLWVRQYACSVARETGETVALIRAASGSTAVDLVTGTNPVETKPAISISHALEKAAHLADRVVIRVDEAAEPELLEREEIDQVTILTGADETAVVASYRLIKTLTASWDWSDSDSPTLRMAVMGGTKEQSIDARAKLTRAVESFLEHPIEIVVSAGRIDASGTMNLYREDVAHPAQHILDGLVSASGLDAEDLDHAGFDEEIDEELQGESGLHRGTCRSPMDRLREDIDALETLDALSDHLRDSSLSNESDTEDVEESVFVNHQSLSGLIPGLSVLESRCPSASGVELAADDHGCVHLVTDDTSDGAIARLHSAKAWVRENLQLLLRAESALAIPNADPRAETEPTLHLLASEPRAIMGVYPTPVRVYALATVEVGGSIARVATPIN